MATTPLVMWQWKYSTKAVCVDIHFTQNGSFHCQSYMYTLIWRFFATVYNSQWRDTLQSFGITLPEMICDVQHTHITDNSVYIHVHIHNVLLQTCQNTCTPLVPQMLCLCITFHPYTSSNMTPPQSVLVLHVSSSSAKVILQSFSLHPPSPPIIYWTVAHMACTLVACWPQAR